MLGERGHSGALRVGLQGLEALLTAGQQGEHSSGDMTALLCCHAHVGYTCRDRAMPEGAAEGQGLLHRGAAWCCKPALFLGGESADTVTNVVATR